FLSLGERDFGDFIDFYKNIKVPFWFNTRIETVSHDRLARLEEVNCSRISIGLESGSEYVRKHLLKRNYSNGYFTEKFKVLKDHNIEVSVNNIIGFPGETRKQIFETIALNRRVASKSSGAYIFQPFRGTYLRDYSVEKGYIDESYIAGDSHLNSDLNMPQLAKDEIAGLQRTFVLYTRLPENYLEEIKLAENFTEEGDKVFKKLAEIYRKDYS
ncbi:MAG: radical SAM protein, partial [Candidatus Omnitrophica bacterium]|nr:radical SAM protein [Candidatus Omnitrophota bacterium]